MAIADYLREIRLSKVNFSMVFDVALPLAAQVARLSSRTGATGHAMTNKEGSKQEAGTNKHTTTLPIENVKLRLTVTLVCLLVYDQKL